MDYEVFGPADMPIMTSQGEDNYIAHVFRFVPDRRYVALTKGELKSRTDVLTRLSSMCAFGLIFHSMRCDCYEQLTAAMDMLYTERHGLLVLAYDEEGRGMGVERHVESCRLMDEGLDMIDAALRLDDRIDLRSNDDFPEIIKYFGVAGVRLLTNNPERIEALKRAGIAVERVPIKPNVKGIAKIELETRRNRLGYLE